ncbi:Uma2 family endonuclease [Planktothrix sp. FACHB-1365]|uniref:Uma2 family endonuclease n=1 Tax=Planktothrix sp. FACHB-1365 TaxID=2692855 RepID=UPI0016821B14|nr:Uma2 family endonuclease [Planktothrix sp. FACHB-1365]MBD2482666.1 Uma2 family endonuclease [Planktothrix sp. FACHB-1365]
MSVTFPIQAIKLTPGSQITISNLSWQDFEEILIDLGEKRSSRVAYYRGTLEMMSPLALHERPHRIIGYILTTILDIQGRDWEDFGSTTLKRPPLAGIEPDTCFYIENAQRVQGCTHLDLKHYPPPDLAIEADVTSKITLEAYEAIGVPEVWIYENQQLKIYLLSDQGYTETVNSPTFPELFLTEIIPQWVQKAIDGGTSKMLRELKNELQ